MADTATQIANGLVQPRHYQGYQDMINSKQAMEPISIANPGPVCGFNRFEIDDNRSIVYIGNFSNDPTTHPIFDRLGVSVSGQAPHWGVPTLMIKDSSSKWGGGLLDDVYGEVPNAIIMPSGKLYILRSNLMTESFYWSFPSSMSITSDIAIYGLVAREINLQNQPNVSSTIQLGLFQILGNTLNFNFQVNNPQTVICPTKFIKSSNYISKYAANMSGIMGFLEDTVGEDTINAINPVTDIICGYYIWFPNSITVEQLSNIFQGFGLAERFQIDSQFEDYIKNGFQLLIPYVPYGGNYFYTPQFTKEMFKGVGNAVYNDKNSNMGLYLTNPYDYEFRKVGFISPNSDESVDEYEQRAKETSNDNPTVLTLFDDDYSPNP
jgi:hypothetical protein